MQQKTFFQLPKREHGGALSKNKRRDTRPLSAKRPLHIVLRSDLAKGRRSLLRNKNLVRRIIFRASKRFHIQIYEKAICGNHLHLLIRGSSRVAVQNFFRVVSGHIAQEILRLFPLTLKERGGAERHGCKKNQRMFWSLLLYSRVVSWGRDFTNVGEYVIRNTLEAVGLIPYRVRKMRNTS